MSTNDRKIIHIDMDAFYASVEQRDRPELRGKPVAVGGAGGRGVVAAASYEARVFGVRSAIASKTALRKCPDLIFVRPDFARYKAVSAQVMAIFHRFTDLVEPLSLDEAYLDVTVNKQGITIATEVAERIRALIREETGLTASAGVSYCKFLAKVASGYRKPDGLTVITPAKAAAFLANLPIDDFYGVGRVTALRMKEAGIHKGSDLLERPKETLIRLFGEKAGTYYYQIVRGIDDRQVSADRVRKSIGAEETFFEDITDPADLTQRLADIADDVAGRCERSGAAGRTVTVKIKYHDFVVNTRSKTLPQSVSSASDITEVAVRLLATPEWPVRSVRLLGISLSGLHSDPVGVSPQLTLGL